jgi:hypothetical protein
MQAAYDEAPRSNEKRRGSAQPRQENSLRFTIRKTLKNKTKTKDSDGGLSSAFAAN